MNAIQDWQEKGLFFDWSCLSALFCFCFSFFILLHMQVLMYSYNSGFPLGGLGEIPLYHPIIWLTPPNKSACLPHYFVQKYCFWNFHPVFGDFGLSGPPHQGILCRKPCNLKICELLFDKWLNWISTSIS